MVFQCHDRDAEVRQYLGALAHCAADVSLCLTVLGKTGANQQDTLQRLQAGKEHFFALLGADHPASDYLKRVVEVNQELLPDLYAASPVQENLAEIVSAALNGDGMTRELEATRDYFRKVRDGLTFYLEILETTHSQ